MSRPCSGIYKCIYRFTGTGSQCSHDAPFLPANSELLNTRNDSMSGECDHTYIAVIDHHFHMPYMNVRHVSSDVLKSMGLDYHPNVWICTSIDYLLDDIERGYGGHLQKVMLSRFELSKI